MFHNTPLSVYEMSGVLYGGSPIQVSRYTDNTTGSRLGMLLSVAKHGKMSCKVVP